MVVPSRVRLTLLEKKNKKRKLVTGKTRDLKELIPEKYGYPKIILRQIKC